MDLITLNDPGFTLLCRVKRGEAALPQRWAPFVAAFRRRFGIGPMWVELDEVSTSGRRSRLTVVLERTAEDAEFSPRAFTPNRSAERSVRRLLQRTYPSLRRSGGLTGVLSGPVDFYSLFVVFADFERLAIEQAHTAVTPREVKGLEERLNLGDRFWCTSRFWGPPVVFVFTESEAAHLRDSGETVRFADLWYAAAKGHDEFGYLSRDAVSVRVDSKENFDLNYASNWYYYFK